MEHKRSVFLFFLILFLIATGSTSCGSDEETYKKPESFIVDPETGEYYVSNVNGRPIETDQNGFIVKLDKDMEVVDKEFIISGSDGIDLNAPKGMVIVGDILYLTDITSVRGYNKKTGENVVDLDFSVWKAKFLNDITADNDGNLYVSDMMAHKIFKIDTDNNSITVYYAGPDIREPNGLIIDPETGSLVVVTWGGDIKVVDKDGEVSDFIDKKFQTLDGVDFDNDGNLYISSFQIGEIYKISPDKKVTTIKDGLKDDSPADISVDRARNVLLVPLMEADKIMTIDLKEK